MAAGKKKLNVGDCRESCVRGVAYPVVPGYSITLFQASETEGYRHVRPKAGSATVFRASNLVYAQRLSKRPPAPSWEAPGTTE